MEALRIEAGADTPEVDFNPSTGTLVIRGKSLPQDAESFYKPLLSWLDIYLTQPASKTTLDLDLEYFNISSSKRILFILYKLNDLADTGKNVAVNWHYSLADDDMKEVGNDFSFMVKVPFQFVGHQRKSLATA